MTTREVLVAARELISDPHRWTTGEYARDSEDHPIMANDRRAVCWCAIGALRKTVDAYDVRRLVATLENSLPNDAETDLVHEFNDNHSHAEVLAVFDKAIEVAA